MDPCGTAELPCIVSLEGASLGSIVLLQTLTMGLVLALVLLHLRSR
jgi:hypothetical protein